MFCRAQLTFLMQCVWSQCAAPSVGGLPNLKFDQDKLVYFGHSQGTVIGGPVLAFEHDYGTPLMGVVWSGSGAELALSILNKTEPIDIKQGQRLSLETIISRGYTR